MRLVIPCWNFGDYLELTLPRWVDLTGGPDPVIVVTHPDDTETVRVCRTLGVTPLVTRSWERAARSDHARSKLNKAAALDDGFHGAEVGELCFSVDADSCPEGLLPDEAEVAEDTIYGCPRRGLLSGKLEKPSLGVQAMRKNLPPEVTCGYFQAFRYSPDRGFGSFPTASQCDYYFALKFPRGVVLDCIEVTHLGEPKIHWGGRVR